MMTTFKPWEYRAEAGFVKGTELTGYTVVGTKSLGGWY